MVYLSKGNAAEGHFQKVIQVPWCICITAHRSCLMNSQIVQFSKKRNYDIEKCQPTYELTYIVVVS